jgi:hypothetical protein
MSNVSNPGFADQHRKRTALRVMGIVGMTIAVALIATALVDFFGAFSGFASDTGAADAGMPTKFWMFFLAMPFFLIGGIGIQLGFLGAAARYGAGETMPVVKDSAAYLTDGEGLLGIGRTVDDQRSATSATGPFCRACGQRNDADATFCDACGQSLG